MTAPSAKAAEARDLLSSASRLRAGLGLPRCERIRGRLERVHRDRVARRVDVRVGCGVGVGAKSRLLVVGQWFGLRFLGRLLLGVARGFGGESGSWLFLGSGGHGFRSTPATGGWDSSAGVHLGGVG